ncbi:MAG: adenylate/guanylate cyclase domain-containing protein [Treponema sp.]|jgi:class 3 adenylate cyclase/CHASE2 domain-containing sensor protein|nr:adenylate/guanylate cyclase domain-containing protein [Treponema sp.]
MKKKLLKTGKEIPKLAAACIIAALVFAVSALLMIAGALNFPEYKTYDFRARLLAGQTRPSDDIIVILLQQESLDWAQRERGWGWPWPRKAYAELVDYMKAAGAKAVALDVLFTEPSVYRNARQDEIIDQAVAMLEEAQQDTAQGGSPRQQIRSLFRNTARALRELSSREDDASFAQAAADFGRVVQGVFLSSRQNREGSWPRDLDTPLFTPRTDLPPWEDLRMAGAQFPIPELRNNSGIVAAVTGIPDEVDGILRRGRLFYQFDGALIPSLAPASFLVSGERSGDLAFDERKRTFIWDDTLLPADRDGKVILRFRGDLNRYVPYDFWEILSSAEAYAAGESPLLPPEDFKDKYVFFGLYAPGLYDIFSTPISSVYPGVGIHVTMMDNLLSGDFIRESPLWLNLVILLAASLLVTLLSFYPGRIPVSLGVTFLTLLAAIGLALAAYHFGNLWLPMAAPIVTIVLSFLASTVYNYATEGSQKRFIKSAFSRYLSPKVIDQIIADPSQLNLGGEKREMTAIFTDVRSFSTISEALGDPSKLVELLNFYLTRMSDIVLQNGGTIDKYEGDAIIAFFGAPVRIEEHAIMACRSAVQMHKAERDINREAIERSLITGAVMEALVRKGILKRSDDPNPLFTRLGINTGDMVVGNMGTPDKMDYTIMGDAVNLAARLEGINKQYNTGGILISEYTRAKLGDHFILRPLSRVRVVGKNIPIRLYELLDLAEEAPPELTDMVKAWNLAFKAYEGRNFAAAGGGFKAICQKNQEDRVARLYLDRCAAYLKSPPEEDRWEGGVDNLTEK